jgi:hypothetical protein
VCVRFPPTHPRSRCALTGDTPHNARGQDSAPARAARVRRWRRREARGGILCGVEIVFCAVRSVGARSRLPHFRHFPRTGASVERCRNDSRNRQKKQTFFVMDAGVNPRNFRHGFFFANLTNRTRRRDVGRRSFRLGRCRACCAPFARVRVARRLRACWPFDKNGSTMQEFSVVRKGRRDQSRSTRQLR